MWKSRKSKRQIQNFGRKLKSISSKQDQSVYHGGLRKKSQKKLPDWKKKKKASLDHAAAQVVKIKAIIYTQIPLKRKSENNLVPLDTREASRVPNLPQFVDFFFESQCNWFEVWRSSPYHFRQWYILAETIQFQIWIDIYFERSSRDSNTYVIALYLWIRFPRHSWGWRWGRSASARLGDQPCQLWKTKNNRLVRFARIHQKGMR